MEKHYIILILCSILVFANGNGVAQGPKAVRKWFKKHSNAKEKLTEFHFYLHDIVSGRNPTNIPVAMANATTQSPTYFGLIAAMDDLLTEGPEPDSKVVGRASGLFGSSSLQELGLHMTFNIVFTEGKYNGSMLAVSGYNQFNNRYRELPIVGGSGVFRLARGVATLENVWYNNTSGDALVEYHVVVLHY
ncbi:dirigent 22-like [Olea europaea subsp. europaea]|uniref:Dirigent protein n=1 Tax=Olea europaea subsp. europaea TaxID=158383 RepID=A0A8S0SC76_OLEEU|nr:dirigent 22-like [Olea europaea subsp. europaea]